MPRMVIEREVLATTATDASVQEALKWVENRMKELTRAKPVPYKVEEDLTLTVLDDFSQPRETPGRVRIHATMNTEMGKLLRLT